MRWALFASSLVPSLCSQTVFNVVEISEELSATVYALLLVWFSRNVSVQ